MRRTSRGDWLSRLAAKRQKNWVWHPEFEPQNQKPGKSAPVTPCECRAEHGALICGVLRRTRPSSHFTCGGVAPGREDDHKKVQFIIIAPPNPAGSAFP